MSAINLYLQSAMHDTVVQGTWGYLVNNNQWGACYTNSFAVADGDEITWDVYLEAGTYTLMFLTNQSIDRGIAEIRIDAALVATLDMYAAIPSWNFRMTQAGIVVAAAGFKTISLKINSKNGASTDYVMQFNCITLFPTVVPGIPMKSGRIHIYPLLYDSVISGTWAFSATNVYVDNAELHNNPTLDGDKVRYVMFMSKGTYTLKYLCSLSAANSAIVSFDIDGVLVASFDAYNAVNWYNRIFTQAGITVGASGYHTLDMYSNGNNPASGSYSVTSSGIDLVPTAY